MRVAGLLYQVPLLSLGGWAWPLAVKMCRCDCDWLRSRRMLHALQDVVGIVIDVIGRWIDKWVEIYFECIDRNIYDNSNL